MSGSDADAAAGHRDDCGAMRHLGMRPQSAPLAAPRSGSRPVASDRPRPAATENRSPDMTAGSASGRRRRSVCTVSGWSCSHPAALLHRRYIWPGFRAALPFRARPARCPVVGVRRNRGGVGAPGGKGRGGGHHVAFRSVGWLRRAAASGWPRLCARQRRGGCPVSVAPRTAAGPWPGQAWRLSGSDTQALHGRKRGAIGGEHCVHHQ